LQDNSKYLSGRSTRDNKDSNKEISKKKEINLLGEDDKKQIISKLEKLSAKLKKRYLKPNFVNYYCNSKNRQKAFVHKLKKLI